MRLFAVRLADGQLLNQYFTTKRVAKMARDKHTNAVVVLGPDHIRYGNYAN